MVQYDEESEQIVIGSLLQDHEIYYEVSQVLVPEDFYLEQNRLIYNQISELIDENQHPDVLMVISRLKDKSQLEKAGGRVYFTQVASQGSSLTAVNHAQKVKDFALRRKLLSSIKKIESEIHDRQKGISFLLSETEKAIFDVSDRSSAYNVQHIRSMKDEFIEFLKNVKQSKGGITGTATSFKEFDKLTSGLKGGQLIILAARPGVGKTTLALNIAQNVAVDSTKPVLIFSLEMTRIELFIRMVCSHAFLESAKIQRGIINDREMQRILQSCKILYGADIFIDDSADLNTWEFKQRSRRLAAQLEAAGKKPGLIIVDYLQLMSGRSDSGDGRYESREREVAKISQSLKMIAKELDVPVLALSQMNRSIEQRGKDPKPQLADLRESGSIEQDADIVMFIHREELYNKELPEELKGQADLIIAKHRAGPMGTIKLGFVKDKNKFMDLDLHEPAPSNSNIETQ